MTDTPPSTLDSATDAQLLGEYALGGSHEAFGRVVGRYIDLVYAAARRQVRDPNLADDVTQAVFLLLAQRAGKLSTRPVIAGWLLLTTRNIAANALKREWRLKRREREVAEMKREAEAALPSLEASSIAPLLDDALARLGETDRDVIVARFFRGASHRDVGQAVGMSEQAATKRVSRALAKLRTILERHGVTASEATLSAVLPAIALKPGASAALLAVVSGSTSAAMVTSPTAVALARGAGQSWWSATSIAGVTAAVATIGVCITIAAVLLAKPPVQPLAAVPLGAAAPGAPAPAPAESRRVTLSIVDATTGGPLVGATVELSIGNSTRAPVAVDASGKFVLDLPPNFQSARVICRSPGRVAMSLEFPNHIFKGDLLPSYTLAMEAGTRIGGVVTDEAGEPVVGAKVQLSSFVRGPRDQPRPILSGQTVMSGADGKWSFDGAPAQTDLVSLEFSHPDYPANQPDGEVSPDDLRRGTYKRVLKWQVGRLLEGVVLDADSKPVNGATVVVASDRYESNKPTARTDVAGKFRLTGLSERYEVIVTTTAAGFAPQQVNLPAPPEGNPATPIKPVEIRLQRGVLLEGVLVDSGARPISGAKLEVESWRGNRALVWSTMTDGQGRFSWKDAPADALKLNVSKRNFAVISGVEVKAGGEPVRLTLYPPLTIKGAVVDAGTKAPIPQFRVIYGIRWSGQDDVTWQSQSSRTLGNGKYTATISDFSNGGRLRVEADGYLPTISRLIEAKEGTITLDFALTKGSGPAGQVVDADGKPVPNARVVGIPEGESAYIDLSRDNLDDQERVPVTRADKEGRYRLRAIEKKFALVAFADQGFANVKDGELPGNGEIRLQKWSQIAGDLRLNGGPAAEVKVDAQAVLGSDRRSSLPVRQTKTDSAGHFIVERVPPGQEVQLYRLVPLGGGSERYISLGKYTTVAGETVTVKAGGVGRPVIGKLALPATLMQPVNFVGQVHCQIATDGIAAQVMRSLTASRRATPDFVVMSDGKIRADEVVPGEYTLRLTLREPHRKTAPFGQAPLATGTITFTVPSSPACPTDEVLDVGTVQLDPAPPSTPR